MGPVAHPAPFGRGGDPDGVDRIHPDSLRNPCLQVCPGRTPAHRRPCDPGGTLRSGTGGADPAPASRTARSDRAGFSLLGGVLLLLALSSGTGLWIAARHLRAITERQVNFDRCTGIAVLRIRSWVTAHERSWKRIESARRITLSLLLTPAGPTALESFRLLLFAERMNQEKLRLEWMKETLRWNLLTGIGCRLRRRPERSSFPEHDLNLVELDAEAVLAGAPSPAPPSRKEYRVGIASRNQQSNAVAWRSPDEKWKVRWSP